MGGKPISWDDDQLIHDYTVLRMSTPALGRKYGVHHSSVHQRLLKLAAEGRVVMRNDKEATAVKRPRFTLAELAAPARELGVEPAQFRDILVRHHVIAP